MNYQLCLTNIKTACSLIDRIGVNAANHDDGRIVSALDEKDILIRLRNKLLELHPDMKITIPKHRYWYDIMIDKIPINLKLTIGGTDNAFNKNAILFSLTGRVEETNCGSFDRLFRKLQEYKLKATRNELTEYHYLVINKRTGQFLLKSIFDLYGYVANPCNILQINWRNEFVHLDHETTPQEYRNKVKQLIETIQTSVRMDMDSKKNFASMDCLTSFENGIQ
jgi:hypothetical protein